MHKQSETSIQEHTLQEYTDKLRQQTKKKQASNKQLLKEDEERREKNIIIHIIRTPKKPTWIGLSMVCFWAEDTRRKIGGDAKSMINWNFHIHRHTHTAIKSIKATAKKDKTEHVYTSSASNQKDFRKADKNKQKKTEQTATQRHGKGMKTLMYYAEKKRQEKAKQVTWCMMEAEGKYNGKGHSRTWLNVIMAWNCPERRRRKLL